MACFQNFVIKDFQLVQETNKCIFMECVMLLLFCLIYKEIIFIGTGLREAIWRMICFGNALIFYVDWIHFQYSCRRFSVK